MCIAYTEVGRCDSSGMVMQRPWKEVESSTKSVFCGNRYICIVSCAQNKTCLYNFSVCYQFLIRWRFFSFQNNSKNLDPSYRTDLDLWDCLGRVKFI